MKRLLVHLGFRSALLAGVCLAFSAANAGANSLSGTYVLGGQTVANTGSYELTSTDSTYSTLQLDLSQSVAFSQLTDLNAVFTSNSGGAGGGSPRLVVKFLGGDYAFILLGPSSFVSDDATLNTYSGVNVIGNNDTGRYDLSHAGGSGYTTYAAALALLGSEQVTDIGIVTDTFDPFPSRDLTVFSINGEFTPAPVPDTAATWLLLLVGLSALVGFRRWHPAVPARIVS